MKELLLSLALANGADLISTEYALSNNDRTYEANPFLQTRKRRIIITSVKTMGEILLLNHASKHSKGKKIVKIVAFSLTGMSVGITINNVIKARK